MKTKSLNSRRLTRGRKLLLAAPVLAGAAIPAAQGAIIYTSLGSGVTVSGSSKLYLDFEGQTTGASAFPGWDMELSIQNVSGSYYSKVSLNTSSIDVSVYPFRTTVANRFGLNDNIVRFPGPNWTSFYNIPKTYLGDSGNPPNYYWSPSATHYYVGVQLISGANYGWTEIALTSFNSMTVYGFAYRDTGASILAGQTIDVPEPAEAGVLAGVLAGSAAAYAARRKRLAAKQAA